MGAICGEIQRWSVGIHHSVIDPPSPRSVPPAGRKACPSLGPGHIDDTSQGVIGIRPDPCSRVDVIDSVNCWPPPGVLLEMYRRGMVGPSTTLEIGAEGCIRTSLREREAGGYALTHLPRRITGECHAPTQQGIHLSRSERRRRTDRNRRV